MRHFLDVLDVQQYNYNAPIATRPALAILAIAISLCWGVFTAVEGSLLQRRLAEVLWRLSFVSGGPNGLAFIKECRIMFIAALENNGTNGCAASIRIMQDMFRRGK